LCHLLHQISVHDMAITSYQLELDCSFGKMILEIVLPPFNFIRCFRYFNIY
jgi:hypothetical protein